MTAIYTTLIPPTRVTIEEAEFVNCYRREKRITISETLRRCVSALRENGRELEIAAYGESKQVLPGFLVDSSTADFIKELAYDKDVSRCQVIRSAIDCMSKKEAKA